MKTYILGAGALGSVFGGILHLAGNDVTLLCNRQSQVDTINLKGLMMQIGEDVQAIPINAATVGELSQVAELIIILVKSQHTADAIRGIIHLIGPETIIISLQNGMGHEDTIAEFVPKHQIIGGKTYVGGVKLTDSHVMAGHKNKITIFGEFNGEESERINKITDLFNQAGLNTKVSTNILGTMWDKLFINVATGAVSAITRLCYGDLYKIKEIENTAIGAVDEAISIAKAKNIAISISDGDTAWQMARAGLPYNFKASMLQSLEAGNKTEIDYINGYVVNQAIEVGISTPINQTLVACVKGIEKRYEGLGMEI